MPMISKLLFYNEIFSHSGNLCFGANDAWSCKDCKKNVKNVDVESLLFTLHQMLNEIGSPPTRENITDLEIFLTTTENLLHDNHYLRIIAIRFLSQLYDVKTEATKKVDCCRKLLTIFDKLDSGFSQTRGLTLVRIYNCQIRLTINDPSLHYTFCT